MSRTIMILKNHDNSKHAYMQPRKINDYWDYSPETFENKLKKIDACGNVDLFMINQDGFLRKMKYEFQLGRMVITPVSHE